MDLSDYVKVLRKRWRMIVAFLLIGLAAAGAASSAATPVYQAQTQLFVSARAAGENTSELLQGSSFTQQRVKSYADIVTSPLVLGPVVDELDLLLSATQLAGQVTSDAPLDTVLINVRVDDTSPEQAARIADAIAVTFTEVVSSLEQPSVDAASPVRVSVVREAQVPSTPVSPRTTINLALGSLVGLAIGVGLSVLRETLDTSVKSTDDFGGLGLAPLGTTIYDAKARSRPVLLTGSPHTPQAEAFRQVRTNLQFVDVDRPPRTVVITSSLPAESKTTTSVNLALTMAMAGVRTVLVDAELRRPMIASYMNLVGEVGLTTVLVGHAELDDVLQPYGDTGLVVLPSGAIPPNPSELLGSQHMADLLARLEERFDMIILDSPPLLPVTDAAVLARLTDGVIVVARHGTTTRDQLTKAAERLQSVDAKILGGILTMAPAKGPDSYGYGYGYGPEAQRVETPRPARAG